MKEKGIKDFSFEEWKIKEPIACDDVRKSKNSIRGIEIAMEINGGVWEGGRHEGENNHPQ